MNNEVAIHNAVATAKTAVMLRESGEKVNPLEWLVLVNVALGELSRGASFRVDKGVSLLRETPEEAWKILETLAKYYPLSEDAGYEDYEEVRKSYEEVKKELLKKRSVKTITNLFRKKIGR